MLELISLTGCEWKVEIYVPLVAGMGFGVVSFAWSAFKGVLSQLTVRRTIKSSHKVLLARNKILREIILLTGY